MSWNSEVEKQCIDCGFEYTWNADTLEIASGNHGHCQKCGSKNTKRKEWTDEKMTSFFGKNWKNHVNKDGTLKQ